MSQVATPGEDQFRALEYQGHEQAWRFFNGTWKSNDQGHLLSPSASFWTDQTHRAYWVQQAYGDCTVIGKWQFLYAGGALPELMVRSIDSRRFYSVRCSIQMNLPSQRHMLMCSIWKGCGDGYARMLGYRRKVAEYDDRADPHKWHAVKVVCAGPEIVVYFEGNFVCAVRDDEYAAGVVGVSCTCGAAAWKDVAVSGPPVTVDRQWALVDEPLPQQIQVVHGTAIGGAATLLANDEIMIGYHLDEQTQLLTRSGDFGQTWGKPAQGKFGYYIASRDELWSITGEHNPDVTWVDTGTNFDELNSDNFWSVYCISRDKGKSWSKKQRLALPFPAGVAYAPIKGKAGAVVYPQEPPRCLGDGAVAMSGFWRNNPDGNYHSDQVLFFRSTDGCKSWSMSHVDAFEWERNESGWVELDGGKILMILRSNYTCSVGQSISHDYGRTWSRVRPLGIPYFGPSAPAIMRTREGVLVLAVRCWGVFTSVDDGLTWSFPTHVGGYVGEGIAGNMFEMSDGRIFTLGSDHGNALDRCRMHAQFIRVTPDGMVHPAPIGPTS